jgi:tetratricopeptide (TPR) repeat protein
MRRTLGCGLFLMSLLPRILLLLGLAWLTFVLFHEARIANQQPDVDASRVVLLFGSVVLIGGVAGVLFVLMVMPSIGDAIGNFFFQPNQQAARDPHADAQAALARGDYAAAIDEYRNALKSEPQDTLAYSEIAKISCEHLADPATAAQALEQALEREWTPDDAAFLSTRLVDVYWQHQRDGRSARAMLLQIIESLPNTRHAANAQHRLHEIEQQIALEG